MENTTSINTVESIKMIQNIISRLANNSFLLKSWTITVVVVTILFGKDSAGFNKSTAFIPIFMFWLLDAYYLYQEQLFRELHNKIVKSNEVSIDKVFDFNVKPFKKKSKYCCAVFAAVEIGFYLPVAILTLLVIVSS